MPIVILDSGVPYRVPLLDENYPMDRNLIVIENATGSAEFFVVMEKAGYPEEYSYQWYVDGKEVPGAVQHAYTMTGLTEGVHTLYCTVTNTAGTVTTRTAVVTVTRHYKPVLNSSYPQNQSLTVIENATGSASFSAVVDKAGYPADYSYQWYANGNAVAGAVQSTYTMTGLTEGSYQVYCVVTNAAGSVTTRTAVVTVTRHYRPTLNSSYPQNQSLTVIESATGSASFSAVIDKAGYPAEYSYQWYVNGKAVSGAVQSTYTMTGLTEGSYQVYCVVSNAAGSVTTRTAVVTVTRHYRPTLNSNYPANVTQLEAANGQATFEVRIATAGFPSQYTYQWYVNGSAVSGATGSTYKRTGLTAVGTYNIYCIVTSAAGSVTSRTAVLNVQSAKPEFTCSAQYQLIKEDQYNYRLKFFTSGKITFSHLGCFANKIDVFCVGGGGGGSTVGYHSGYGGGGAGGYTKTTKKVSISAGVEYEIIVGSGGAGATEGQSASGGKTSAFGCSANGGTGGAHAGGNGGSGGARGHFIEAGAQGGTDGSDGGGDYHDFYTPGKGQGSTTREFGEAGATLYSGGGSGLDYNGSWPAPIDETAGGNDGSYGHSRANGVTNRGGGGSNGGSGGSGIVVIRNAR